MTQKEKLKETVVKAAISGQLSATEAGKRLGMSDRNVRRLKAKMRSGKCLKHGNSRSSPKKQNDEFRENIVRIRKDDRFCESNFVHFQELLLSHFGIKISYMTLKRILNEAGIKSPKKQRRRKIHKSREPKEYFGELLQTDASQHQWFLPFGDTAFYSLHGFIDDSTGTVTGVYFSKNECLDGYFEAFRQTLERYGIPEAIYADGLSLFFGKEDNLSIVEMLDGIDEKTTQFGKILDELGVDLIHAHSPQAKGKIERLWQTLQSRLITEFKINSINNMEKANRFLPLFLDRYNNQFAKPSKSEKSRFLPLSKINLDILLAKTITRKLDSGLCFSLNNIKFRVDDGLPNSTVKILMNSRIGMKVLSRDKLLTPIPLTEPEMLPKILYFYLLKNERLDFGKIDVRKHFFSSPSQEYTAL